MSEGESRRGLERGRASEREREREWEREKFWGREEGGGERKVLGKGGGRGAGRKPAEEQHSDRIVFARKPEAAPEAARARSDRPYGQTERFGCSFFRRKASGRAKQLFNSCSGRAKQLFDSYFALPSHTPSLCKIGEESHLETRSRPRAPRNLPPFPPPSY